MLGRVLRVPGMQPGRAADQPPEAILAGRDAIREAVRELPDHAHARCDPPMTIV